MGHYDEADLLFLWPGPPPSLLSELWFQACRTKELGSSSFLNQEQILTTSGECPRAEHLIYVPRDPSALSL